MKVRSKAAEAFEVVGGSDFVEELLGLETDEETESVEAGFSLGFFEEDAVGDLGFEDEVFVDEDFSLGLGWEVEVEEDFEDLLEGDFDVGGEVRDEGSLTRGGFGEVDDFLEAAAASAAALCASSSFFLATSFLAQGTQKVLSFSRRALARSVTGSPQRLQGMSGDDAGDLGVETAGEGDLSVEDGVETLSEEMDPDEGRVEAEMLTGVAIWAVLPVLPPGLIDWEADVKAADLD